MNKDTHFVDRNNYSLWFFTEKYGYYILPENCIGSEELCQGSIERGSIYSEVKPIPAGLSGGWLKALKHDGHHTFEAKVLFDNSDGPLQIKYPVYDSGQYVSFVGENKEEVDEMFEREARILILGLTL